MESYLAIINDTEKILLGDGCSILIVAFSNDCGILLIKNGHDE